MLINVKCPTCIVCRENARVLVHESDYYDWRHGGKLAQDAFPYLNDVQRELLISGTHPKCWNDFIDEVEEYANSDGQRV
jgi:hypothetical protein